jgi:uncharacterized protein (DUF3084 family)
VSLETILVAAVMAAGGILREFFLWRDRRQDRIDSADRTEAETTKLEADAELVKVTAAETVSATVLGMMTVMDKKLSKAEEDLGAAQADMRAAQGNVRNLERELRETRADLEREKARTQQLQEQLDAMSVRLLQHEQEDTQ